MFTPLLGTIALLVSSLFSLSLDGEKMAKLFGEGNAEAISACFNSSIQLTTPGKQGVYSRSQAKMILEDFFETNKTTNAVVKTVGNSDNGAQYISLDLNSTGGTFHVNISYRGTGEKLKIHELKIEK